MNRHWTKIAWITCLLLLSSGNSWAFLDFLKSPATLILNQKDCTFNRSVKGAVVNGNFILNGRNVVAMSMERLDDDHVIGEVAGKKVVLDVGVNNGVISAVFNNQWSHVTVTYLKCLL